MIWIGLALWTLFGFIFWFLAALWICAGITLFFAVLLLKGSMRDYTKLSNFELLTMFIVIVAFWPFILLAGYFTDEL